MLTEWWWIASDFYKCHKLTATSGSTFSWTVIPVLLLCSERRNEWNANTQIQNLLGIWYWAQGLLKLRVQATGIWVKIYQNLAVRLEIVLDLNQKTLKIDTWTNLSKGLFILCLEAGIWEERKFWVKWEKHLGVWKLQDINKYTMLLWGVLLGFRKYMWGLTWWW